MKTVDLRFSTQINDGLHETCADGASLAFDAKYGIMFCAYMPGYHGDYGESRGKIHLSYFPASQPTNIRYVEVARGEDVYVPNILGLGDGCVRVFYERNSRKDGDHTICFRDFNFITEILTEEKIISVKKEDGTLTPLCLSAVNCYLDKNGFCDHVYRASEQMIFGGFTPFRDEEGYTYGALPNELSEVVLFRSKDNMETVEFFAIYPRKVQYEFDYKMLDGKIYALYRTTKQETGNTFSYSEDGGKTWSEPANMENSIECRPRVIISGGRVVLAYNYFCDNCGKRPKVIMGRTAIKICTLEGGEVKELLDLYSKYGIVNVALCDVLGDVYLAYSTSHSALEYQNGTPYVRGKDAIRFICLGDIFEKEEA